MWVEKKDGSIIEVKRTKKGNRISNMVTPDKVKFVKELVKNGGRPSEAVRATYPGRYITPDSVSNKGQGMLRNPVVQRLLAEYTMKISGEAGPSVEKLAELRDDGESEKTQLDASKALLEAYNVAVVRGGKEEQGTTNNILITGMTDEQLVQRINDLRHAVECDGGEKETGS